MIRGNSKIEMDGNSLVDQDRIYIEEIYDLSFIELLTINYLTNNNEKILRYELYKSINRLLYPAKNLSTGSFYRSLSKTLLKRGFIEVVEIKDKKNHSTTVNITEKGKSLVGFWQYYLMQHTITSSTIMDQEIVQTITDLTKKEKFQAIMIIEPDMEISPGLVTSIIPTATETIKSLGKITKRIFLLSTELLYSQYLNEGIVNINRSQIMDDGVIREPDNYFDLIIFPLYGKNINYYGKNYIEILKEIKRLLSENGHLIVIHHESIESANSHYLYSFINQLTSSGYFHPHMGYQTRQELSDMGFDEINLQSVMGLMLVCGKA